MKQEEYIKPKLFAALKNAGINMSADYILRHDGEPCDNILFEKDGIEKRIDRTFLFRVFGRCRIQEINKNIVALLPITNEQKFEFLKKYIINYFNGKNTYIKKSI